MSRLQLALNVPDIDSAVDFYSKLFATGPNKRKPGYANFAIADPPLKLVLFEKADADGRLNHLGVEVESLLQHRDRWVTEPSPTSARPDRLDGDESALYADLVGDRYGSAVRLEQERLDWGWVLGRLPYG